MEDIMPSRNLTAPFVEKIRPADKQIDYFDKSLRGLSLRVSPTGKKTWCVLYRFGGKLTRHTLGVYPIVKLADARKQATGALRDVSNKINPAEKKKADRTATTFRHLAAEYLERHAKRRKKSWRGDERIINKYLLPVFGETPAKDITRRDIRSLLDKIAVGAPIMANRIKAQLSKMFNFAVLEEIVTVNPAWLVPRPAAERPRDRVLSEDELKRVWRELDTWGAGGWRKYRMLSGMILKLQILTAQRAGEVRGMAWHEIEGDWWTLPGERSKNKKVHRIPLSTQAMRIIEDARALAKENPSEYVFPGPHGGAMASGQKPIERVRERTGIDFRGHDLRRTTASMMAGMGIPRLVISKILNHAEPGVTAIYDRHSYDREKREALEAWGKRLSVIVSDLVEVKRSEL